MKRTVYGGEAGTENDNAGSRCPKTRRRVTGKVRVISSILGCQREATQQVISKTSFRKMNTCLGEEEGKAF